MERYPLSRSLLFLLLLIVLPSISLAQQEAATASSTAEVIQDDRTWLDVFGEVAHDYLTQEMIPPTDDFCQWDWRVARCEPYCQCTFRSQWGDYHLGRSCRKRLEDDVVCDSDIQFDPLRLLEYAEDSLEPATHEGEISAAKQILFQTVKGLQFARDKIQKWTFRVKEKTHQKYEQWQDQTCASITPQDQLDDSSATCALPSNLTWKQQILCRESLCDDDETPTFKEQLFKWRDKWFFFWKRNPKEEQEEEKTSEDLNEQLPNWSTSDWSAGIANSINTHPPPNSKPKRRRPRVTPKRPTHNINSNGGFGGIPIPPLMAEEPKMEPNDHEQEALIDEEVHATPEDAASETEATSMYTIESHDQPEVPTVEDNSEAEGTDTLALEVVRQVEGGADPSQQHQEEQQQPQADGDDSSNQASEEVPYGNTPREDSSEQAYMENPVDDLVSVPEPLEVVEGVNETSEAVPLLE